MLMCLCLLRLHYLILYDTHVGGAVLEDGDGTDLAQVYNPKTAVWTEVAPMQIARSGSAACTLKGKIYVIGNDLMTIQSFFVAVHERLVKCL